MKKTLLFMALLSFGLSNAQTLINDNYNTLTVGNITTDVTGATAGQGNYFAANGVVADYQIVSEAGTQANVVQITGSATATGTKFLFKDITSDWAARTGGNNTIDVEFDIFTGAATTSKNTARVYLYNSDGSTVLAGLSLNLETKVISGIAYYDPNNGGVNPVNTYSFNLGASNAVLTLTANSWVRMGLSYNTTTRQVIWKGPGFYVGVPGAVPATGTTNPSEIDYLHTAGTGNVVSATSRFDNLLAKAVVAEGLLGTSDFNVTAASFVSVYPNPFVDFVSINLVDTQINSIKVVDMNGRLVKTATPNELLDAKVDLSDLTSGIYLMTIDTDKGVSTKKIIKN